MVPNLFFLVWIKKPIAMQERDQHFGQKDFNDAYLSQINWDWLFLKGQMIFSGIIILGLVAFLLWFV